MISRQKEKYGWEFLFISANIDAVETASHIGIGRDRAVNYNADSKGTRVLYDTVCEAVGNMRACCRVEADWAENINRDYHSRKK